MPCSVSALPFSDSEPAAALATEHHKLDRIERQPALAHASFGLHTRELEARAARFVDVADRRTGNRHARSKVELRLCLAWEAKIEVARCVTHDADVGAIERQPPQLHPADEQRRDRQLQADALDLRYARITMDQLEGLGGNTRCGQQAETHGALDLNVHPKRSGCAALELCTQCCIVHKR